MTNGRFTRQKFESDTAKRMVQAAMRAGILARNYNGIGCGTWRGRGPTEGSRTVQARNIENLSA